MPEDPVAPAVATFARYRADEAIRLVDYETGDTELYNLTRDPYELRSVAGKPRYAAKQRALEAGLDRLRGCRGRGCEVTVRSTP